MILGISRSYGTGDSINNTILTHYRRVHFEVPRFEHMLETLLYSVGIFTASKPIADKVSQLLKSILEHEECAENAKHGALRDLLCHHLITKTHEVLFTPKGIKKERQIVSREILGIILGFFRERGHSIHFLNEVEETYLTFIGEDENDCSKQASPEYPLLLPKR